MDIVSLRLWDYLEERDDQYLMIFDDMDIWTQLERLDLLDHLSDSDDDFAIISDGFWSLLNMSLLLFISQILLVYSLRLHSFINYFSSFFLSGKAEIFYFC